VADVVRLLSARRRQHRNARLQERELALKAACDIIGDQGKTDVEVGPMLAAREGNVFKEEEIRRMCDSGTA
jgi:hypothetical protein